MVDKPNYADPANRQPKGVKATKRRQAKSGPAEPQNPRDGDKPEEGAPQHQGNPHGGQYG